MKSGAAFEGRFAAYHDRLFGYAAALSRDRELARDLLHECIVKAMAAREAPQNEAAYRAWLFTIMRNLWIDHIRANRRKTMLEDAVLAEENSPPVCLENIVINAFAVRQAFQRLSLDHRDVLALVDISGFTYEEAAEILSIPRGTVMSRVSRARQALAALLSDNRVTELHLPKRSRTT